MTTKEGISSDKINECIALLEQLNLNAEVLAQLPENQRIALLKASGQLSRPLREEHKERYKAARKVREKAIKHVDRQARAETGIRSARLDAVFKAPEQLQLPAEALAPAKKMSAPRNCYVCKVEYDRLHFFYDAMCPECGDFNYHKRFQTTDLHGKVAFITGSRLKIGYHITLMLLRSGARVIATTRFPVDSANRFALEADFSDWKDRLHIYGLDLRHIPSVEIFASYFEHHYDRLDILINNAAQTVRRPPGFYTHLMDKELLPYTHLSPEAQLLLSDFEQCKKELNAIDVQQTSAENALPVAWNKSIAGVGIRSSAQLSQIPYSFDNSLVAEEVFPTGKLDADLQQVDLRTTNSWRLRLGEIQTPEMIEVQLVNAVAPFVLCNRLVNVMKRDNTGQKHVVNVSAMEGKFHRFNKIDRHPHTNMAKAALNMLTHTSASDLAKYGIYMNAVDTGWVTDEDPIQLSTYKQEVHDFQPPLDIVDGAARVCDPFIDGINTGKHWCGKFLKDYKPIDW